MEDEYGSLGDFIDKTIMRCLQEFERNKRNCASQNGIDAETDFLVPTCVAVMPSIVDSSLQLRSSTPSHPPCHVNSHGSRVSLNQAVLGQRVNFRVPAVNGSTPAHGRTQSVRDQSPDSSEMLDLSVDEGKSFTTAVFTKTQVSNGSFTGETNLPSTRTSVLKGTQDNDLPPPLPSSTGLDWKADRTELVCVKASTTAVEGAPGLVDAAKAKHRPLADNTLSSLPEPNREGRRTASHISADARQGLLSWLIGKGERRSGSAPAGVVPSAKQAGNSMKMDGDRAGCRLRDILATGAGKAGSQSFCAGDFSALAASAADRKEHASVDGRDGKEIGNVGERDRIETGSERGMGAWGDSVQHDGQVVTSHPSHVHVVGKNHTSVHSTKPDFPVVHVMQSGEVGQPVKSDQSAQVGHTVVQSKSERPDPAEQELSDQRVQSDCQAVRTGQLPQSVMPHDQPTQALHSERTVPSDDRLLKTQLGDHCILPLTSDNSTQPVISDHPLVQPLNMMSDHEPPQPEQPLQLVMADQPQQPVMSEIKPVQSEHKATDKVKKRLQERYYDTQQTVTDAMKKNPQKRPLGSQQDEKGVETFEAGSKISSWRLKEWKKQRFQKAEEAEAGSKSKTPKMKQQRKGKDLLLDNTLEAGYLVYEEDEEVDKRLSQSEIAAAVDVTSASKFFELNLNDFGPYNINYTRNGRHLLLGGSRGHVASFDWQTKRLSCEFNAMETVNSVKWLHQETMFAAAQCNGVCFYDNQGIELHMLQNLDCVLRMEFLPYHMLLVTANEKGFLAYTDVSMGTRAAGIKTGLGRLDTMTQNPANAVVCLGHASGTVTLWAPSVKDPLMKMLTHKAPVRSVAIDTTGTYLATSGIDKRLKVFDLRTQKVLTNTHIPMGASSLAFSQRSLLAASMGNRVQIYKDVCQEGVVTPYLSHVCGGSVQQVQFCPFEDVLGVGHLKGFTSLIIPGSGDPNVDAMEVNPMATKKQRQHMEVRLLLDKLDPEMISLNNWVTDLAPGSKAPQSTVQQSTTKLGKKQKEEQQREKARSTIKSRPEKKSAYNPKDPLSRFKKAAE